MNEENEVRSHTLLNRVRARYDPSNIVDQIEWDLLEQELDETMV